MGLGLLAWSFHHPVWKVLAGLSLTSGIVGVIAWVLSRRRLTDIAWNEDRFLIQNRTGSHEYLLSQVDGLSWYVDPWYASGNRLGDIRHVRLWITSGSDTITIKLTDHFLAGEQDPLLPWIRILAAHVKQTAEKALTRKEEITGDGWRLAPQGLFFDKSCRIDPSLGNEPILLSQITASRRLRGEIRFWLANEDQALFSIPQSGKNAWLLELLVGNIAADSEATAEQKTGPLGRVLFERKASSATSWITLCLGLLGLAVGLFCLLIGLAHGNFGIVSLGTAIIIAGMAIAAAGRRIRKSVFRCHEHGIYAYKLSGEKILPFKKIDVCAFDIRRQTRHGRYVGTMYSIILADHQTTSSGLFHSETVPHEDEELEQLKELVSESIARRMAARYAQARQVQWTPELWFRGTQLEYTKRRRFWRSRKSRQVPLAAIEDYEIRDGWFYLWIQDQQRPAFKVKTATPNFYPGLLLLERLTEQFLQERHSDPFAAWEPSSDQEAFLPDSHA